MTAPSEAEGPEPGPGQAQAEAHAQANDEVAAAAVEAANVAEAILEEAAARRRSPGQRRREALLDRLAGDPAAKRLAFRLTDRVARAPDAAVAAHQLQRLAAEGIPASLPWPERLGLWAATRLSHRAPGLVMPLVAARIRAASTGVIVDAAPRRLRRHLRRRSKAGITSNINVLGEAILGEGEAAVRLARVLRQVQSGHVSYVSVKLSAVAANLSVLAFDETVQRLAARLRPLYVAAAQASPPVFINLDMEEYRDLPLTLATFQAILGEKNDDALHRLEAGIVLQAYLPDSFAALCTLLDWAETRVASGGAPVKVRLVKGANLAMEAVEAELHGWAQAPYATKADVDANYKRLVEYALRPRHAAVLRVGVASHNLYDVCFALALSRRRRVSDRLDIEMLEGMANAQAMVVAQRAGRLVLYTPVAAKADFASAIAYLTRRLDENTAPENYLAHLHRLAGDPVARREQRQRFETAVAERDRPFRGSHRELPRPPVSGDFTNQPDSDFTSSHQRDALVAAITAVRGRGSGQPLPPPPASVGDIDTTVAVAVQAAARWGAAPLAERRRLLDAVADRLSAERFETVALMGAYAAKVVAEADSEVSEAVDFARYYGRQAVALRSLGADHVPFGVVAVVSPWNFPYAIPAGGVLAALAAGNAVILKPAPQTEEVAYHLVRQLWAAGVPTDLVQYLAAPEDERGRRLLTHPEVAAVILTGSSATAELFCTWRPSLRLHAETSGKNAVVVTATADIDQAVRDIVRSAFGHAGQKCSAASLAIVEQRALRNGAFLRQLRDAVESLPIGLPDDLSAVVGPLIGTPSEQLQRAFDRLDAGESWLVTPRCLGPGRQLWSPGVRLGVTPASWFHQTECFGPVLGVMEAPSLEQATAWQNAVAFGLTGGLQSLDEEEIAWWLDHVEVGNAYVNRSITGAIVGRQPFGGWKRSVVGPGAKAGGPNYVASLGTWREDQPPSPAGEVGRGDLRAAVATLSAVAPLEQLNAAAASYEDGWRNHFSLAHDPSGLGAESNRFRYRPLPGAVLVRLEDGCPPLDASRIMLAALTTATPLHLSVGAQVYPCLAVGAFGIVDIRVETQDQLAERLASDDNGDGDGLAGVARLRVAGPIGESLWRAARARWLTVIEEPPVSAGRVELCRWLREQAVSASQHRYGVAW